uniref:Uncharacterized protein n=1 Tax=Tanacetum cinerariifolium TaxID=118510 RepID=A0A699H837_TANCI|nr:hypothetical protein [Tanacetum cinerariifolium]
MSSESSAVTYTSFYTASEPRRVFWGADEELSDGGSPRVIVYGYDGLPMQPVAPPSPDYIPGPEDPHTPPVSQDEDKREPMFIPPHDPDYVPEPMYPEYIPLEDEHVLPAKEQPLPPVNSPTAESPRYVAESDPEEYPEEYEDDKIEDGPVDYPIDGGDDGDDDDSDSSKDDIDDDDEDDEEEEEDDVPETKMPPRKRLGLSTLSSRYEIGESFTARPTRGQKTDYGFVSTLDAEARRRGIRRLELAELYKHDTHDLYALLEDDQDSRTRISQRVTMDSQWVELLMEDRIAHQETILIMEEDAYAARDAWAHSIGLSQVVHSELQTHHEQAELLALREQPRRPRQLGSDARVPDHQDAPRDADNHI